MIFTIGGLTFHVRRASKETPSMNTDEFQLSPNARKTLELIAEGHSYEQILKTDESFTYLDIFNAAGEALKINACKDTDYYQNRLLEIRKSHPRAYEKWTPEEDAKLTELFRAGTETNHIAAELQRQPSAIQSRFRRLGLVRN